MKPIYFPFTYVSFPVARILAACFGQFIAYQPLTDKVPESMQPWIDREILNIRVPTVEDLKEMETTLCSYLQWADLHTEGSGLKTAFMKFQQDSIPYASQSFPSQIVSDIKKKFRGSSTMISSAPIIAARIFLYFAQEFDRFSQEVVHDLEWHHQREKDLIRHLKMEVDTLAEEFRIQPMQLPDAANDYMISDRMEAWTRVLLEDKDPSGMFVTHSPTALDHILHRTPTAEKIVHFGSIPLAEEPNTELDRWHAKIMSTFAQIVQKKWPAAIDGPAEPPILPATENTVALSVYLVPDQLPHDFFSGCAEIQRKDTCESCQAGGLKNTLIGFIK